MRQDTTVADVATRTKPLRGHCAREGDGAVLFWQARAATHREPVFYVYLCTHSLYILVPQVFLVGQAGTPGG